MAFKEYESPELLREVQRVTAVVLAEFDRVCRSLDIPYVAYGGTAIGAVRHQGFIPWDDDVDVAMMRSDYERFLAEVPAVLGDNFEIHNTRNHRDFTAVFSFLTLKGTQLVHEDVKDHSYRKPVSVDLFPLDNVADDPKLRRRQCGQAWFWGRLMYLSATGKPNVALTGWKRSLVLAITSAAHGAMRVLHMDGAWVQKHWDKVARRYEHDTTDLMADFSDLTPMAWAVTAEDMFPAVDAPFENITIKIPRDYDKVLTNGFGDYMELPPVEKRKNHAPYFIDLGEY